MITEVQETSPAVFRAVFCFGKSRQIRIELDVSIRGNGQHSNNHAAEMARIIDANRYHQRFDPECSECEWQQVLSLIWRCHEQARLAHGRLITTVRIEEGYGANQEFRDYIESSGNAAAVARTS